MRKIQTIAAMALLGLSALTACSKKSSSPTYVMKATVGSTSFNESSHVLAIASGGGLIITGSAGTVTTSAPPQITIAIVSWSGSTGTTTFDSTAATGYEEYLPNSSTVSESKTGTVTITSVSSTAVSGTFSFTATDGTVVSNGSFTAQRS
jgi:hypothetical protein